MRMSAKTCIHSVAKMFVRACLLASLLSLAGIAVSLHAQEPASSQPASPSAAVEQDSAHQDSEHKEHNGPGHQLKHAAREAAGEEKDEME